MKKITLLLFLIGVLGYSQTLPINFSDPLHEFNDTSSIFQFASDPDDVGNDVGQIDSNAGDQFGSLISLDMATYIDITDTDDNTITFRMYSTESRPCLLQLYDEENGGLSVEINFTTAGTGWETFSLDFDMADNAFPNCQNCPTPLPIVLGSYGGISIFTDFGVNTTSTYFIDDIDGAQNGSPVVVIAGPTLPLDFEDEASNPTTFGDFNGSFTQVVANPGVDAINGSVNVAENTVPMNAAFAGVNTAADIDITVNKGFSMQVRSPIVGIPVLLKLEGATNVERSVNLTGNANEWEEITFDFSSEGNLTFNSVTVFMNFNVVETSQNVYYWDNLTQIDISSGLSQIDLPVDFEGTTTNYTMTDFGGNTSSLVIDPEDSGNMAIQSIKTAGAELWAGTTIGTAAGFATNIPLTLTNSKMNVRVWSPDAGIPIRLKLEDANDATHTVETETNTTVAGAWETLEFDFVNEANGTESLAVGLSNGWVYNKASIFFNFGTDGATAGEKTYFFDDVKFGGLTTASVENLEKFDFKIFPNPTKNRLQLKAISNIESIEIFDMSGRKVLYELPNEQSKELNIIALSSGVYFVRVGIEGAFGTSKIIKK